jgi:hypothetical protein
MPIFIKNFKYIYFLICLFFFWNLKGQELLEVAPPSHIKTIEFKSNSGDQFPIVKLGEIMLLQFDDLLANEQDYYYKIIHCRSDWSPSDLLKPQYLEGVDNQRILEHPNSYNTLVSYTHFQLSIPNEFVSPKISGNYMLQIFNTQDILQFSRKFMVYEGAVSVQASVRRSRTFEKMNSHQVLQFSVNVQGIGLNKPETELKVVLIKNYQWSEIKSGLQPQFNNGATLIYDYDLPSSFKGGNEYLNFDTKDIRAATATIRQIDLNDIYEHYLYTNIPRNNKPYTYFPDLNGDFMVRTLQGIIPQREADYSWVHFGLKPSGLGNENTHLYVIGKFNNYELTPEYKMSYDPASNSYQAKILFKQGFYNYSYALATENLATGSIENYDPYAIDGSFHFTENQYQIFVYFRGFGDLYERLVGVGSANSSLIRD